MAHRRNHYSAQFKFQVALEALKELRTMAELSSHHGVHANQIGQWKRQLLQDGPEVFNHLAVSRHRRNQEAREARLYEQIGRLQMELEWVKKKAALFAGGATNHD